MEELIERIKKEIEYCYKMAEEKPQFAIIWRSQAIGLGKALDIIKEIQNG